MIKNQPKPRPTGLIICALALLAGFLIAGCNGDAISFHESVPVTREIADSATELTSGAVSGEPKFQMITAIVDREDAMWFFKLTGPIAKVDSVNEGWLQLLDTVKFEKPEPQWELPENWASEGFQDKSMMAGMSMRIANIATTDPDVTISVSSLPSGQQILPNVNRWRGQLGLPPTDALNLATQLTRLENETVEFKVFDAKGPQLTTRMGGGRPPFAGGRTGGMANGKADSRRPPNPHAGMNMDQKTDNPAGSQLPFTFDAPKDWQPGKTSSMIVGNWTREVESEQAVMKLLSMNPTDESWELNVKAFAAQVKIDPPEIDDVTEKITVAGRDARSVTLQGAATDDDQDAAPAAVRAVLFSSEKGDGYMLMLTGTVPAIESASDDFQKLLDSIKFEKSDD